MPKNRSSAVQRVFAICRIVPLLILLSACNKDKAEPVTFQAQTDDGVFDSSQYEGQVIYLDFWASWCVPCRASFPWMNDMRTKYADQGLEIVAVTLDHDQILARQFADEFKAEFTIAYDLEGTIANQFGVKALPSSFIICLLYTSPSPRD